MSKAVMSKGRGIGDRLERIEDDALLRGQGHFLDDLYLPGALEIAFLRSTEAHARFTLDLEAARLVPGVVLVVSAVDIADQVQPMFDEKIQTLAPPLLARDIVSNRRQLRPVLPRDTATFVGQAIAMVVAEDRYVAEDALEYIEVSYEPLPVVVDPDRALEADAPLVEKSWTDNLACTVAMTKGNLDDAFSRADVVVKEELRTARCAGSPLETRGVAAQVDPASGRLTVWTATQMVHTVRDIIARCLDIPERDVVVRAPDTGGGFGVKSSAYPEEVMVAWAARTCRRPLKWVEDRNENLMAATHARERIHRIALAADSSGRILGVRDDVVVNLGAINALGPLVPFNSASHLLGPYDIESAEIRVSGVLTNTGVTAPYRGAGRPEAVFAMERMVDILARKLGLSPFEVRRVNLVSADAMPYTTGFLYRDGNPQIFDSGDYPEMLDRAEEQLEILRARAIASRADDAETSIGFGLGAYVEGTGIGPFESGAVAIADDGGVIVSSGASSQGQGHRTSFAQIVGSILDMDPQDIEVRSGDTGEVPYGFGTVGSRSMVLAGNAIAQAAETVKNRLKGVAAAQLDVDEADLVVTDGEVRVGADGRRLSFSQLIAGASPWRPGLADRGSVEMREVVYFQPPASTFSAGIHGAVVEVNHRSAQVKILGYVVVHDAGVIVNPLIADGQIVGGVAQGIGEALLEEIGYDADGQLLTGSFMDYMLPTSHDAPDVVLVHLETPSPLNPLGVKGVGEGGAIAPPAVVANAVEDALAHLGATIRAVPITPTTIHALLTASARTGADAPSSNV